MINNKNKVSNIKYYVLLHTLLAFYSLGGVYSKLASQSSFLSLPFVFWYGLGLANLFIYAILWQQIIKHLPLTTAYANKAVTIVWGIIWGMLFFKEIITWNMIVGAVVVIIGVILVVMADE